MSTGSSTRTKHPEYGDAPAQSGFFGSMLRLLRRGPFASTAGNGPIEEGGRARSSEGAAAAGGAGGVDLGISPLTRAPVSLDLRGGANPNMLIAGQYGKTQTIKKLSIRLAGAGERVAVLDTLGGQHYRAVAEAAGGKYVALVPGGPYAINPCELDSERASLEEIGFASSSGPRETRYVGTYLLGSKVERLTELVSLMAAGAGTSTADETTRGLVMDLWAEVYREKGITEDPVTFANEPPSLTDFFRKLEEARDYSFYGASRLELLRRDLDQWGRALVQSPFGSTTWLDLPEGRYLVFALHGFTQAQRAVVAYALLTHLAASPFAPLGGPQEPSTLFIDELAPLTAQEGTAGLLVELWRRARFHNLSMVGATRGDSADEPGYSETTRRLADLSGSHLMFKERKRVLGRAGGPLGIALDDEARRILPGALPGKGLLFERSALGPTPLYVDCTEEEMRLFNTQLDKDLPYALRGEREAALEKPATNYDGEGSADAR